MKKVKIFALFVSLVFIFGLAFTSCRNVFDVEAYTDISMDRSATDGGNRGGERSRRETLAIQKSLESHTVSVNELSQIVLTAFNQTREDQTTVSGNRVVGTRRVETTHRQRFECNERSRNNRANGNRGGNNNNSGGGRGRSVLPEDEATDEIVYEENGIELFEFAIREANGDEWFVMSSNDTRVGHILSITQGSLETSNSDLGEFLRTAINNYIDSIIIEYNDISDDEIDRALEKLDNEMLQQARGSGGGTPTQPGQWRLISSWSDLVITRQPLLATQWGQGAWPRPVPHGVTPFSYNNYIQEHFRLEHLRTGNHPHWNRYIAGCGPVAVAQVFAFHRHMDLYRTSTNRDNMAPNFNHPIWGEWRGNDLVNINIFQRRVRGYDFALINNRLNGTGAKGSFSRITDTNSTPQQRGQVAALLFHVFMDLEATPSVRNINGVLTPLTVINRARINPMLTRFGYIVEFDQYVTSASGTKNNFNFRYYHSSHIRVMDAIDRRLPIIARGQTEMGYGHIWVIDGYGWITQFTRVYRHTGTGQQVTRNITMNSRTLMVHCNMGWDGACSGLTGGSFKGGIYSGWFIYGIFDTTQQRENPTTGNITAGDGNFSIRTRLWIARPR